MFGLKIIKKKDLDKFVARHYFFNQERIDNLTKEYVEECCRIEENSRVAYCVLNKLPLHLFKERQYKKD